jgi:hypothetical protein
MKNEKKAKVQHDLERISRLRITPWEAPELPRWSWGKGLLEGIDL